MRRVRAWLLSLAILLAACRPDAAPPPSVPAPTPTLPPMTIVALPTATSIPPQPTAPAATPVPTRPAAPAATATATLTPTPARPLDPQTLAALALISEEQLLATVQDLTAIQPHSGWRNSGTEGEREALDYVARRLSEMPHLASLGLEIERQSFNVLVATETWQTELAIGAAGRQVLVPADTLRGPFENVAGAMRFDSDGRLNDREPNPVIATGPILTARSVEEFYALSADQAQGKLLFLNYAVLDQSIMDAGRALTRAGWAIKLRPAGLVLVTTASDRFGPSHGTYAGDGGALVGLAADADARLPMLIVRFEDLAAAGIATWDDLAQAGTARMTWDTDVLSPAPSGNLVARIPGLDPSHAVILSAHVDSPNNPGALDDASGTAALLEVARVIDAAGIRPATDVILAWFGSEELSMIGAYRFVATHQELLDRTLAVVNIDCLARPLDGVRMMPTLSTRSYRQFGDTRLLWPDYLVQLAARQGIALQARDSFSAGTDIVAFQGFDAPNANLGMEPVLRPARHTPTPTVEKEDTQNPRSTPAPVRYPLHYVGHMHDPYETIDAARAMRAEFAAMTRAVLLAALETGRDAPDLHVPQRPTRRAVFVASHTEADEMSPATLTVFGMTLAMAGYDVDMVPYGRAVTPADLSGADLVVVLPVFDYPSGDDASAYDEAWSDAEAAALEEYVANGGFLVLTNSARRLRYGHTAAADVNEDWADANALAGRFGVRYDNRRFAGGVLAAAQGRDDWVAGVTTLETAGGNAVAFTAEGGQVLAALDGIPVAARLAYGPAGGKLLVLADLSLLGARQMDTPNILFWQNMLR